MQDSDSGKKEETKDAPREPGSPARQFKMGRDFAGLGTSFKYFSANQGELKFKQGFFGSESIDAKPRFVQLPSETVYDSAVNAQIVVGPNKPRGELSTRLARAEKGIATIDLVAGRMGSYARSYENDESLEELKKKLRIAESNLQKNTYTDIDDLSDPNATITAYNQAFGMYSSLKKQVDSKANRLNNKPILTNNNYKVDAARVVIAQKGDVDTDFGLRPGRVGSSKARSFVAMKGDDVRIVARESIKIVTGTDDENSQGGRIDVPRGIDLIGANDDKDMQPLVKGTYLLECLDDIIDNISALNGVVIDFMTQQMIYNTTLAFHTHITTGVSPAGPTVGVAYPAGENMFQWALMTPQIIGTTFLSLTANKINLGRTYIQYLIPKPFLNDKFLCSKYNHTN